ncbi:MAG: threonine synthase [Candidatus Eremiobacterota bacterium]
MSLLSHLECCLCAKVYRPDEVRYVCPACGPDGLLDVHYDYAAAGASLTPERLRRDPTRGISRYAAVLPVRELEDFSPVSVGATPLTPAVRLGRDLGLTRLSIKEDNRNPTGSFKDRASAVALAHARGLGERIITGASTGNAASSLAGLAAAVGLTTVIFVPRRAPLAKVTQLLIFGAHVLMVEGSYDDACDLCLEATRRYGWYNRNTGYNPMCLEGKKTVSLELWEDLAYDVPDAVLVSVGDGCIIGGIGKGFADLVRMGLARRMPRLYGVQAEGSSVLARAYRGGGKVVAEPQAATMADSICVGYPRAAAQALRAVRESAGDFVVVTDAAIMEAQTRLARGTGVFAEPAGAAAAAGLFRLVEEGRIGRDERVVVVVTGSGLKDIETAMKAVSSSPIPVPRDPVHLEEALRRVAGLL